MKKLVPFLMVLILACGHQATVNEDSNSKKSLLRVGQWLFSLQIENQIIPFNTVLRILLVSFGSGAGSDSMAIQVTEHIEKRRNKALMTMDYVNRRTEIDYATYVRMRGKLVMK